MHVNFGPRGYLEIDDARIVFRNFAGEASKYNRKGDRNFAVVIPNEEIAEALIEEGWNVKIKAPREEGDAPFMFLPVKVKFNDRGPIVKLITNGKQTTLTEESISCLDYVDIVKVDMDLRPYDWKLDDGKTGRTAYLQKLYVTQEADRFAERYAEEESPEE